MIVKGQPHSPEVNEDLVSKLIGHIRLSIMRKKGKIFESMGTNTTLHLEMEPMQVPTVEGHTNV